MMKPAVWCGALLLLGNPVLADEDDPTTNQTLLGVNLEGALSKQVEWSVKQAVYLDSNQSVRTYAPRVGLSWEVTDWLSLGAAYRLLREKDEDEVTWTRRRALVNATAGFSPLKDWKLSYRLRWQGEWRDAQDAGTPKRFFLRNRVKVKYGGFKRFGPYVSAETYHRVDEGKKTSGVEKTRYTLGGEIDLSKHHSFDLYGRRQVYFNDDPTTTLIGLEYTYSFK